MTRDNAPAPGPVQPSGPAPAQPHPPSTPEPDSGRRPPFLSQRTVLILFISVCVGIGADVLTFLVSKSQPGAVLAGVTAFGGCTAWLNNLVAY
ncbi:hypothetical protein [Streptomyces bikiniensis]|uniref:hypothetical protein n=1 Tax=Streptomyces bikiniensis TaxID=1896 RepID=UPI0004C17089|nr:hypothetical protein [Streptomyces bikiniensis]